MVTARFCTRCMVLLISIVLLSACGGDDSTTSTSLISEGGIGGAVPPVSLVLNTTAPRSGTVGNKAAGKSYYTVNVSSTTTYTITLYGLSADADLLVYNDLPFDFTTGPVCTSRNGGTANEQCVVKANSGTMNIEVDGQYSLSGATYFISVNSPNTSPTACSSSDPGCFNFDSETQGATSFNGFVQSETGSLQWSIDCTTNVTGGTGCSIYSTGVTNALTSCVSYTAATTSTTPYISFNMKVTSTPYYDLLLFYIDNVLQTPVWSGAVSPQGVMFNTASGTHTYQWCHSNSNTNAGATTSGEVWVDDIYIQ
jgi:hypothetical protein